MNNETLDTLRTSQGSVPASFGDRVGAALIDFLIIGIPLVGLSLWGISTANILLGIAPLLINIFYKPVTEGLYGKTLGKHFMKINVTDLEGNAIDLVQSIIRNFLYLISGAVGLASNYLLFTNEEWLDADGFMERSMIQQEASGSLGTISMVITFILLISCLAMLANQNGQTLHDKVGRTLVLKKADNPFL